MRRFRAWIADSNVRIESTRSDRSQEDRSHECEGGSEKWMPENLMFRDAPEVRFQ